MVLEHSKSLVHNSCLPKNKHYSEEDLKKIILQLMQKNGIPASTANITNDGVIELNGIPGLNLHTLMLQAEEMGLNIRYTKKTLIEVC